VGKKGDGGGGGGGGKKDTPQGSSGNTASTTARDTPAPGHGYKRIGRARQALRPGAKRQCAHEPAPPSGPSTAPGALGSGAGSVGSTEDVGRISPGKMEE
jgi:hypothetical protein